MKLQISEIHRLTKIKFEYELEPTEKQISTTSNLIACTPVKVIGDAKDYGDDMIILTVNMTGTFTVPCANTGKILKEEFSIDSEIIVSTSQELKDADIIIRGSEIDLNDILWTEIAVNVPLIKSEQLQEIDADGWSVLKKEKSHNPFADLKDKLK